MNKVHDSPFIDCTPLVLNYIIYYFIFSLIWFSSDVLAIPLNDFPQNEKSFIDTPDSTSKLLNKTLPQEKNSLSIKKYKSQQKTLVNQSMSQETIEQGVNKKSLSNEAKQKYGVDDEATFDLFEQDELGEQKSSLELYQ